MLRIPYSIRKFVLKTVLITLVCLIIDLLLWHHGISFLPKMNDHAVTHDVNVDKLKFAESTTTETPKTEEKPNKYKVVWKKLSLQDRQLLEAKPVHELSTGEPYLGRKQAMQEKCRQLSNENHDIELSRMVYDDKHKFVMCVVPKAASTTWRSFAWYLLEKVKTKEELRHVDQAKTILNRGNLPTLASLNSSEAMKRLSTYTTFFAMRHPFDRLVSAHDSKFTPRDPDMTYKMNFGRRIAIGQAKNHMHGIPVNNKLTSDHFNLENLPEYQKLNDVEKSDVAEYVKIIRSGEIPFRQFAKYVANQQQATNMDVHWRPQVSLCNPCAVNYDFVIKFEDLSTDSNKILEYLQRGEPEERKLRLKLIPSLVTNNKTIEQMKTLDSRTKQRLEKIYGDDFAILGYN